MFCCSSRNTRSSDRRPLATLSASYDTLPNKTEPKMTAKLERNRAATNPQPSPKETPVYEMQYEKVDIEVRGQEDSSLNTERIDEATGVATIRSHHSYEVVSTLRDGILETSAESFSESQHDVGSRTKDDQQQNHTSGDIRSEANNPPKIKKARLPSYENVLTPDVSIQILKLIVLRV